MGFPQPSDKAFQAGSGSVSVSEPRCKTVPDCPVKLVLLMGLAFLPECNRSDLVLTCKVNPLRLCEHTMPPKTPVQSHVSLGIPCNLFIFCSVWLSDKLLHCAA